MVDLMVKCFVEYPVWSYGVLVVATVRAVVRASVDHWMHK